MILATDTTSILDEGLKPRETEELNVTSAQWSQVIPFHTLHSWQLLTLQSIQELSSLPANWDSYGSPPPSSIAIASTIRFIQKLGAFRALWKPQVAPVSGGGFQLLWREHNRTLDLEVLPEGSFEYLLCEGDVPIKEGQIPSDNWPEIDSLIKWVKSA